MPTYHLALAHVLEGAGIGREGAERVASAIFDAIHDNVATKADIAAVRTDLAAVRTGLKADIAELRTGMVGLEHRIALRGTSVLMVAFGIILAALRFSATSERDVQRDRSERLQTQAGKGRQTRTPLGGPPRSPGRSGASVVLLSFVII